MVTLCWCETAALTHQVLIKLSSVVLISAECLLKVAGNPTPKGCTHEYWLGH